MLPFQINLNNFHPQKRCPKGWLIKKLGKICHGKNIASISFVDNSTIKKLNLEHLGENRPTDVLSYNLSKKKLIEGEIIISIDMAMRHAKERNVSLRAELLLLCIHGLLHLLGERDYTKNEKAKMMAKEIELLLKCMESV